MNTQMQEHVEKPALSKENFNSLVDDITWRHIERMHRINRRCLEAGNCPIEDPPVSPDNLFYDIRENIKSSMTAKLQDKYDLTGCI
jgi:hypothetical protein